MNKLLNNIKLNIIILLLVSYGLYVLYLIKFIYYIPKSEAYSLHDPTSQTQTTFNTTLKSKKECEFKHIWADLNEYVYFKIKTAYYIKDSNVIRIFYVSKTNYEFNLSALVTIQASGSTFNHTFKPTDYSYPFVYPQGLYKSTCLELKFDLNTIISAKANLSAYFYIGDEFRTKTPIKIKKMSYKFKDTNKNLSMLCSKCFFLSTRKDYDNFKWWVYLNKRIGYKKIFFCNNDMAYPKFSDLFKANSDFFDIQNFKCMPNFIAENKRKFIESLDSLRYRGVFSYSSTDIFNSMFTNECYLKYAHKYKYITVVDNDETIIPRLLEANTKEDNFRMVSDLELNDYDEIDGYLNSFKCNRYRNESRDYLEAYVNELERTYKFKNSQTYYFQQGYYLKNELMSYLLDSIERYLNKTEANQTEYEIIIPTTNISSTFYFRINGSDELKYARNLCKLNRVYVQPYLEKNKNLFENVSDNFRRFFALISAKDNQFNMGKTVHKTTSLRSICVHTMCGRRDKRIDMNHGHLSHFRGSFRFKEGIKFSIRQLVFDLNYFNCYMKPILLGENSEFYQVD